MDSIIIRVRVDSQWVNTMPVPFRFNEQVSGSLAKEPGFKESVVDPFWGDVDRRKKDEREAYIKEQKEIDRRNKLMQQEQSRQLAYAKLNLAQEQQAQGVAQDQIKNEYNRQMLENRVESRKDLSDYRKQSLGLQRRSIEGREAAVTQKVGRQQALESRRLEGENTFNALGDRVSIQRESIGAGINSTDIGAQLSAILSSNRPISSIKLGVNELIKNSKILTPEQKRKALSELPKAYSMINEMQGTLRNQKQVGRALKNKVYNFPFGKTLAGKKLSKKETSQVDKQESPIPSSAQEYTEVVQTPPTAFENEYGSKARNAYSLMSNKDKVADGLIKYFPGVNDNYIRNLVSRYVGSEGASALRDVEPNLALAIKRLVEEDYNETKANDPSIGETKGLLGSSPITGTF